MVPCGRYDRRGGSGCAVWGGCVSFAFQPRKDGSDDPATLSRESLFEDYSLGYHPCSALGFTKRPGPREGDNLRGVFEDG